MEFLGVPFFDDDVYKLLFRFALNFLILFVVIRYLYYPNSRRKDYLVTYFLVGFVVFFVCFALKKFELGIGLAIGLFAIFGIIRYRTDPIPIKEMTYLFLVIGISVINALSNKKMSYTELIIANGAITLMTFVLERLWLLKHETRKSILYEKIEMIKPENYDALVTDLEDRTGLKINRIKIGKVDFLRDTANVVIYYYEDMQSMNYEERFPSN